MSASGEPDLEITPQQTKELVDAGGAQLVDVREDHEWEAGRITGARHIALAELAAQAPTLDQDQPVIFQCLSGARSLMAAQAFRAAGYEAYSMAGGLQRWHGEGLPLEGRVAAH